ncbi:MAG: radical SAM protein [Nitrospirae bacterium]|nr:radical SAM protein [Nitrospirota bacterium]
MNRKLKDKANSLISQEKGVIFKDPGGRINIGLCYPNTYSVAMSSLGFQGIYGFFNSLSDVVCERIFFPDKEDLEEYQKSGSEPFSLESKRPLSAFDIIAFSVSFENDYPNLLKMLKMARIPLRRSDRSSHHPLVIMGGVAAFYNPEPLADFMDVIFVGEAEEMLEEFLSHYRGAGGREELLEKLTAVKGIYLPEFYTVRYDEAGKITGRDVSHHAPETVCKRTIKDIARSFLRSTILTPHAEFSNMFLLEAMRGCPWSCRFCVAGHIYNPPRKKDFAELSAEIRAAVQRTQKIGLIGPSLSDYPHAEEILQMEGVDFSITSLRASPKSARLVRLMKGHRSISIAPEAGTQRLRDVVNKKIGEEDILETARQILECGVETLRLYFMIGLPTETMADIDGMMDLVRTIRRNTRKGQIRLSVSTFVPKPFTPFQWHPMEPLKSIKEKLQMIKKGLAREKGVKVLHDIPKQAHLQGLFALGDRRVGRVAERIALDDIDVIKKGSADVDIASFIYRQKDFAEPLPWDFIDAGVTKEHLWAEYQKALNG